MSESRWWRFYIEMYYPYMYGLYVIECTGRVENKVHMVSQWKNELMQELIKFFEEKNIFYDEEHLRKLLEMDMTEEFGEVLCNDYGRNGWPKKSIHNVLNMVTKITN